MPTYGLPETGEDSPMNPALAGLRKQIADLQNKRASIVDACEHHFIPKKGTLKKLGATHVSGVYNAGTIGEIDGRSEASFPLVCSKCGEEQHIPISDRCPVCAEVTKGDWGTKDEEGKYFGGNDFGYNGLWLISCTRCDFKAAGLRWDH